MERELSHLGLNFIVGLDGPVLLPVEARMLERLQPVGIILFAKNIAPGEGWIELLQSLISDIQSAIGRPELIISIDHEGGRVHRLRAPVTHFPAARYWASRSRDVARVMGRELRALGFNTSWAPVLDVHSEEQNTVIGLRAFGTEPEGVAAAALEFAEGLHSQGVLSCGKHFPGHGATVADSHYELPVLHASEELLRSRDLAPFVRFIETEPPLLMTAHVHYPVLDPSEPASTSRSVLQRLLREELQFQGALVSDDLEMAALAHYPPGERARRVLGAGVDLLLHGYSRSAALPLETALEMADGLADAIAEDSTIKGRLNEAQARVEALLEKLRSLQAQAEQTDYPLELVGCEEHTRLAAEIGGTLG